MDMYLTVSRSGGGIAETGYIAILIKTWIIVILLKKSENSWLCKLENIKGF